MAASVEPGAPTQYLQVTGMVTPDVLADDEEYNEVGFAQFITNCPCSLQPSGFY